MSDRPQILDRVFELVVATAPGDLDANFSEIMADMLNNGMAVNKIIPLLIRVLSIENDTGHTDLIALIESNDVIIPQLSKESIEMIHDVYPELAQNLLVKKREYEAVNLWAQI